MKNLIAATYAPMHKDLSINTSKVAPYAQFLKRNNIAGVFINGSTGDFVSLSTKERMDLLEAWAGDRPEGLFLINHVGHNSLVEAEKMAEHSVGKADALGAIAPFYFRPGSLDQLIHYCGSIARKASDLPFYYYHLPVLTGVNFPMALFAEKAKKEIPNFAGIKFTENNLVEFHKVTALHPELDIFFGVDEAYYSSLALNSKGWVGSTYNHLSPLFHLIRQCYTEGHPKKALELQFLVVKFVETLSQYGNFNGAGKSFMKKLGIDCGPSRFPHPTLNDAQLEEAYKQLNGLGLGAHFSQ